MNITSIGFENTLRPLMPAIQATSVYIYNIPIVREIFYTTVLTGMIIGTVITSGTYLNKKKTGETQKTTFNQEAFPPEFKKLIQSTNEITSITKYDMGVDLPGLQSRRNIHIGKLETEKVFFKKSDSSNSEHFITCQYAQQEQLAYMISHQLDLGVVPATIALEAYENAISNISTIAQAHLGKGSHKGYVLQEGIQLHPDQFHMHPPKNEKAILDTKQLYNAIFFNIIVGRTDATERNTVIDSSNRVMEIDNETIGADTTDSWLLTSPSVSNYVLDKAAITELLSKEDSLIDSIFSDFKRLSFSPIKHWNYETNKFYDDKTEMNIRSNFKKLRTYLKKNKNSEIKVSDLAGIFHVDKSKQGIIDICKKAFKGLFK